MNDQEFEDQAAIQIMAALASSPKELLHTHFPQGIALNPEGYAKKAYVLASALLDERRRRPITPPLQNTVFTQAARQTQKP